MRHDPDFTRAHPANRWPITHRPSGGFCFSGCYSPKRLHDKRGTKHAAHRASLP
jgi:hypothetical protein